MAVNLRARWRRFRFSRRAFAKRTVDGVAAIIVVVVVVAADVAVDLGVVGVVVGGVVVKVVVAGLVLVVGFVAVVVVSGASVGRAASRSRSFRTPISALSLGNNVRRSGLDACGGSGGGRSRGGHG